MPIKGAIVQLSPALREHLERLNTENAELRARVKEQERELRDVRHLTREQYRDAKAP